MADALEPADQRRQAWSDQSRLNQILGQCLHELLLTPRAPLADHPMFFDAQRSGDNLYLLNRPNRGDARVGQFSSTRGSNCAWHEWLNEWPGGMRKSHGLRGSRRLARKAGMGISAAH